MSSTSKNIPILVVICVLLLVIFSIILNNNFNRYQDRVVINQTTIGGNGDDYLTDFIKYGNNEFLITGWTDSTAFTENSEQEREYSGFIFSTNSSNPLVKVGGSSIDNIEHIAIGQDGGLVVVGTTNSSDFEPAPGPDSDDYTKESDTLDLFLIKFSPNGTVVWSRFLGGPGLDVVTAMFLDESDNIYLGGYSHSPSTFNHGGEGYIAEADGYLTRIDSSGSLRWSTYIGGSDQDFILDLSLDAASNLIFAGLTQSSDFPQIGEKVQERDIFVGKSGLNGENMQIVRLGTHSSRTDENPLTSAVNLGVDADNNIITGTWVDGDQDTTDLSGDGVIIYKHAEDLGMIWKEVFDGTNDEQIVDIEIHDDQIFAVGSTTSYDIPVKNAFGYAYQEFGDIFILTLTTSGELIFSSYLGGNFWDFPTTIQVDESGLVIIGGITSSTEFLGKNIDLNGYSDAFLLQLDLSDTRYNLPIALGIFLEQTSVFEWIILITSVIFVSRALSYYSIFRYLEYLILTGLVLSFTLSIFSYYLSFVLDNYTQNLMILNKPIALLSISMILIQIHAYRTKWDYFPKHLVAISGILMLMKLVSPLFIVLGSGEEMSTIWTILPVVLYSLFDIYTIGLLLYAYLTFDLYNPVPRASRLHKIWIVIWIIFAIGIVVLLFFTSLEFWLITQQDLSDHIVQVNLYRELIFIYQSGIYIVLTFLAIGIMAISYPEGLVLSQTQFIRALKLYQNYRSKQPYPQAEDISESRLMSYIRNAEQYMVDQ